MFARRSLSIPYDQIRIWECAQRAFLRTCRYSEWLATLQATPPEDNLALQLRRAGMFKRCTDKAKGDPEVGHPSRAASGYRDPERS
jgi:hypothetical protein